MRISFSIIMIMIVSWGSSVCAFSGITIQKPRLANIAEISTDITGIAPKVQTQTSSQPLLAEDINTVYYLNESNVLGSPGSQYWDILDPGNYILNIAANEFSTNHSYAIRIFASNVIFDGKGKTITGPGIGTVESGPSYYGIRVNWGYDPNQPSVNVTVKNVNVTNKFFGVIYEYVQGGEIRDSHFASNDTGIYTWKSSNLNILSNTVNSNNKDGIVLDAHQSTNDYFTIDSNNVYENANNGIMLWFSNNHNTITNNQVNRNYTGIALTDGGKLPLGSGSGTDNTISGNTVNGNVNGIFVSNYNENRMNGNSLSGNSNAAVFIQYSSNNNIITNNQVNDNMGMGIVLTDEGSGVGGTDNTLSYNTVNRNANGIFVRNYHNNSITGNSLSDNTNVGVWLLQYSSGNQFTGNSVVSAETTGLGWRGVYLESEAHGNIFYNNLFKNSDVLNSDENYGSDGSVYNNQWYTTPTPGVNIVGGPTVGGNYWGNLRLPPTGFSDTHPDSNNDGFCDQPYNPKSDLIDNYPLHRISVNDAQFTGNTIPSNMVQGQSYPITVTVNNNGTTTWDSNYMLGGVGDSAGDAAKFGPLRIAVPTGTTVAPGQSYTFSFSMTPSAAGTFTPKYQMVQSNWFGQILSKQVTVTVTPKKNTGLPWLLLLLQ